MVEGSGLSKASTTVWAFMHPCTLTVLCMCRVSCAALLCFLQLETAATAGVVLVLGLIGLLAVNVFSSGFPAIQDGSLPLWSLKVDGHLPEAFAVVGYAFYMQVRPAAQAWQCAHTACNSGQAASGLRKEGDAVLAASLQLYWAVSRCCAEIACVVHGAHTPWLDCCAKAPVRLPRQELQVGPEQDQENFMCAYDPAACGQS